MSVKDDFNRMAARRNADALFRQIEADKQVRAERMPTEQDAIRVMFEAWQRLKELGWREGQYMPTTGERHAGIQCGSTGIHAYTAEHREPFNIMYTIYDGDIWPTRVPPVLFRPWQDTDVQPNLRPCYPMLDESAGIAAWNTRVSGVPMARWVERCRHPGNCIKPRCGDFCYDAEDVSGMAGRE